MTETQREDGHVLTEAEIQKVPEQATECQGWLATTRRWEGAWNRFFPTDARRNQPCQHLDFRFLASTTVSD